MCSVQKVKVKQRDQTKGLWNLLFIEKLADLYLIVNTKVTWTLCPPPPVSRSYTYNSQASIYVSVAEIFSVIEV